MIDETYIRRLAGQLSELETRMSQAASEGDHRKLRKLVGEHAHLKKITECGERVLKLRHDISEHRGLIEGAGADPELKALALEENADLEKQLPAAEREMTVAMLPPEPNDSRNVIVEVRAGTGGEEAALFAADLFRMYSRYCESRGWRVGMIDASPSSVGGYKEVVFSVEGRGVYGVLKYESGGHRVQRVPVTEAQGRIHTSAATVAVLPEAEEEEIDIPAEDLRIDIFCSSGPGGQGVNTTYSAVRITHVPTGVAAQSQDERSQKQNKEKAMKIVLARVLDHRRRIESERAASEKRSMIGSGDRSERIRTYNFPQNRLTDHRINLTLYTLDRIIDGDLQPLLDELYRSDMDARMKKEIESSHQV
ncbi:MAG: peptide chain release factor 1, partial [bacterium]